MSECRHGRPECECQKVQPLSSGRWDASGSWEASVEGQKFIAKEWAEEMTIEELRYVLDDMADDMNAFTLYERQAALRAASELLWQYEDLQH